jgi:hypothetical protein
MTSGFHPALDPWLELGLLLAETAGKNAKQKLVGLRPRRGRSGAYRSRRPGVETPLWNVCAARLRDALKPPGAKARFARFLGIPRQRLNDYLNSRNRLPDAELVLQMLAWFAEKRSGRDISV